MAVQDEPPVEDQQGYRLEAERPSPPPVAHPARATLTSDTVGDDVICLQCGYSIRGLSHEGRCPECGTLIKRSLQGNLLRYSSPAYLATLNRGVFLILAAIAAKVICVVGGIILIGLLTGRGLTDLARVSGLLLWTTSTGLSVLSLIGWWLFSAPDPAFVGTGGGTTARKVVRTTVAAAAVLTAMVTVVEMLATSSATRVDSAAKILLGVVLTVKFFAAMLYLRWLAHRFSNVVFDARARLLMWLCPLLVTVGMLFCFVGPIIALVLYWNLLNWVRIEITRIRQVAMAS